MDDAIFNARLQAIESAFRHLIAIRIDLESSGVWSIVEQKYLHSDLAVFTDNISCELTQLYLDKANIHG